MTAVGAEYAEVRLGLAQCGHQLSQLQQAATTLLDITTDTRSVVDIIIMITIIIIIIIITRYRDGVEAVEAAFLTFVDTGDKLEDKVEEFRSHKGPVINVVIGFVKQKQKYVLVL